MKKTDAACPAARLLLAGAAVLLLISWALWDYIPIDIIYLLLPVLSIAILLLTALWSRCQRRQQIDAANEICETLDALMDGREPAHDRLCEDSQTAKVQGKLLWYYDRLREGQRQSEQERQTIQELISNISHQVKTPLANLRMFTSILQQRRLSAEKQAEFLAIMAAQTDKLEFLMESLIKMSRLETGTFALHMETGSLYHTIAQAVDGILAKADQKQLQIDVDCDSRVSVRHDAKWTAEALGNLLDNAVKYTPAGGAIHIRVRPWQFYTRIDISDTGIGIDAAHYNDIFRRFYRGDEAASAEGVGLGLYLARSIITWQKGYISVASEVGNGSTFSVFLRN